MLEKKSGDLAFVNYHFMLIVSLISDYRNAGQFMLTVHAKTKS